MADSWLEANSSNHNDAGHSSLNILVPFKVQWLNIFDVDRAWGLTNISFLNEGQKFSETGTVLSITIEGRTPMLDMEVSCMCNSKSRNTLRIHYAGYLSIRSLIHGQSGGLVRTGRCNISKPSCSTHSFELNRSRKLVRGCNETVFSFLEINHIPDGIEVLLF